jgi:hypothetical protein
LIAAGLLWSVHDAGALPWLATAGYFAAGGLCAWRWRTAQGRERRFWLLAALALLALGLNKELDLQTELTAFGRQLARNGGWYANRRAFQALFVLAGGAAGLALLAGLAWLVRGLRAGVQVTLAGLGVLALFVMVRAASFHHLDVLMGRRVLGLKLHIVLELAGIAMVIIGALLPRRSVTPAPHRRPGYHR